MRSLAQQPASAAEGHPFVVLASLARTLPSNVPPVPVALGREDDDDRPAKKHQAGGAGEEHARRFRGDGHVVHGGEHGGHEEEKGGVAAEAVLVVEGVGDGED